MRENDDQNFQWNVLMSHKILRNENYLHFGFIIRNNKYLRLFLSFISVCLPICYGRLGNGSIS